MPNARCKFQVVNVAKDLYGGEKIKLEARYSEDDPEDTRFHQYTPSGEMVFRLDNPSLNGSFEPGDFYYIDLTPVE